MFANATASLLEGFALAAAAFVISMLAKRPAAAGFAEVLNFSVGASLAALLAVEALPKMNEFASGRPHVTSFIPARTINRHCTHPRVTLHPLAAATLHWHATQKTRQFALLHAKIRLCYNLAPSRAVLAPFLVRFQVRHDTLGAKQVAAGELVQRARTALVEQLELAGAVVQNIGHDLADAGKRS